MPPTVPGQTGNRHTVDQTGHDHVGRLAVGRIQIMFLRILQGVHMVEAASADDTDQGMFHIHNSRFFETMVSLGRIETCIHYSRGPPV